MTPCACGASACRVFTLPEPLPEVRRDIRQIRCPAAAAVMREPDTCLDRPFRPGSATELDRDGICFYGLAPSATAAVIPSNRESSLSKSREPSVAPLVMCPISWRRVPA